MNQSISLDNRIWTLQQRKDLNHRQLELLKTADVTFLQDREEESKAIITALEKELGD